MDVLIAIAHILGSIIAVFIFNLFTLFVANWEDKRNQKRVAEDTSVRLGVTIEELDKEENGVAILKLSSEKYSTELLKNRISDFLGMIRTLWGWLLILLQVGVLLGVIWHVFTDGSENAIYAWFNVGISIFFWLVNVTLSLMCKLLTGRYPAEAKNAREAATAWMQKHAHRYSKEEW